MHYSENPGHCCVSIFKHGGTKWSHDLVVDMSPYYNATFVDDAVKQAIADELKKHDRTMANMEGLQAICLDPYHKNAHPISLQF